jgi:predicted transcriptional regulator
VSDEKKQTVFEQFVLDRGVNETALLLGVTVFSVYHYLRGTRRMRFKKEDKLIKHSGGRLSAKLVAEHYSEKQRQFILQER